MLDDLPVSDYLHCQLSELQQQLYRSYAQSARDELVKLVKEMALIEYNHVLATY